MMWVRTFVSKDFLSSRFMLWSLFGVNLLGTAYGYEWYGNQLVYTARNMSAAYLPFVPDSPTASLFFTLVLVYLLRDSYKGRTDNPVESRLRSIVEGLAVVTSFKYGIWAVSMIWAGAYQGDSVDWQGWMLSISHLGMAIEVLLYFRLYTYRLLGIAVASFWTLWNDGMDYGVGVYPWLPESLSDDLPAVALFTVELSFFSIIVAWIVMKIRTVLANRQV